MLILLAAATLAAALVPTATVETQPAPQTTWRAYVLRGVLNPVPSACRQEVTQASGLSLLRPQDRSAVKARKLADLPKANLEIAVERRVGGCPAPVIVRYDVGR